MMIPTRLSWLLVVLLAYPWFFQSPCVSQNLPQGSYAAPSSGHSGALSSALPPVPSEDPLGGLPGNQSDGRVVTVEPVETRETASNLHDGETPRATASIVPGQLMRRVEDEDPETDLWKLNFRAGQKAAQLRIFDQAEKNLLAAIKEAKQGCAHQPELALARGVLGDVYLKQDNIREAEKLYNSSLSGARSCMGNESEAVAHAEQGLAEVNISKGNFARAQELCKHSIQVRKNIAGTDHHDLGLSLITMGTVLAKDGRIRRSAISSVVSALLSPALKQTIIAINGIWLTLCARQPCSSSRVPTSRRPRRYLSGLMPSRIISSTSFKPAT